VEKYGTAREATNDKIIRRMRFACWVTDATDTHSESVIRYLLLFHGKRGYVNADECYFIRTLAVSSCVLPTPLLPTPVSCLSYIL
jgi:hypothetical protein